MSEKVDLVGCLSNSLTNSNLQRLTSADRHQARPRRPAARGVAPDGRRKFGTVSDVIVQVLSETEADLRVREIKDEVERRLRSPVSRHSIKGYLSKQVQGENPLFERTSRGRYTLAR